MKAYLASTASLESPRWPERFRQLAIEIRSTSGPEARERILSELWPLLCVALLHFARRSSHRSAVLSDEDLRDAMADKALHLVRRIEAAAWDPSVLAAAEIRGFLATVARNAVVDLLRRRIREVPTTPQEMDHFRFAQAPASSAIPIDAEEHARAIVLCCSRLTPRARLVWFLRVFLDLASADIASHPGVRSSGAAVDSMLLRCRIHMKACLESRGLLEGGFPPGTFVALHEIVLGSPKSAGRPARMEVVAP